MLSVWPVFIWITCLSCKFYLGNHVNEIGVGNKLSKYIVLTCRLVTSTSPLTIFNRLKIQKLHFILWILQRYNLTETYSNCIIYWSEEATIFKPLLHYEKHVRYTCILLISIIIVHLDEFELWIIRNNK